MEHQSTQSRPNAPASSSAAPDGPPGQTTRRRKNHRGGKKKRSRHKSFALHQDHLEQREGATEDPALSAAREDFYQMHRRNLSGTSLDSEALLDHRDRFPFIRPRRPSIAPGNSAQSQFQTTQNNSRPVMVQEGDSGDDDDERAPLLSNSNLLRASDAALPGGYGSNEPARGSGLIRRDSSRSSNMNRLLNPFTSSESYNVNYPPSVPGSPPLRPSDGMDMSIGFGDALLRDDLNIMPESPRGGSHDSNDEEGNPMLQSSQFPRRHTIALQAEEDVCFPQDGLSEIADEDLHPRDGGDRMRSRRRRNKWPDLGMLDEWSRFEKEGRSEERRAKKITEPQLINGRLRPVHKGWFRTEEEAPYRFTYFNEEFQSTIHSQAISELVQSGAGFRELFIPDPPILSDSEDSEDEDMEPGPPRGSTCVSPNRASKTSTRQPSLATTASTTTQAETLREGSTTPTPDKDAGKGTQEASRNPSPAGFSVPEDGKTERPTRFGDRPVWWLDVLSPTEAEMKVLSKTFGIHPLTAEDIMMQEAREKVELFRHYYFVSYRSFDQDQSSENFLEPVNMYVVVFREGVISFHFSMTPHPANVRRRIRQLRDYMILSSDWISYAIIDDITDVFVPLIQNIEDEVDEIDDAILQLHSSTDPTTRDKGYDEKAEPAATVIESGADMLRRVGDCRKRVMGLYRLLGNKADVIKGFAKRCNEHWEVAPRSEIGLYLGDIQDHIVTMTSNLGHYEKILARCHANYIAQINIRMNERAEKTADVLGKLTVLGTIVLPMNIITGLWGMNVWVPGQEYEGDLTWFYAITAGLLMFGVGCYMIAKRVYQIV